jgi:hypothetical protein
MLRVSASRGISRLTPSHPTTRTRCTSSHGEFGTIQASPRADLVIVGEDPLADIEALRRPVGVMVRGEWLPRDRLDALVREALATRAGETR